MSLANIYDRFVLEGNPIACERYGSGHINHTYLLTTDQPHAYILQKLNTAVFADVPGLMQNLIAVTDHLRKKDPDPRHVLTLVPTTDGEKYLTTEDGEFWRMYEYVADGVCLQRAETPDELRQSGVAFGRFQSLLSDFPAETLAVTIPRFHDTPWRYEQLKQAVHENRAGRLLEVQYELGFYLMREHEAGALQAMTERGELPLRVTHNDAMLNNVMLDKQLRTPLCVIDLDTVMPGLAAHDFGDGIRYGASTATEDEKDLSKVSLDLEKFEAYTDGFLSECSKRLTRSEIETLALGAKTITLECGVRFLTDFLNGDIYFQTDHPCQNLDRARTQMKLVQDMESKWTRMQQIVLMAGR